MREKEPRLIKNWDPYMRTRQVMASAAIFKNHGWGEWKIGHAKLFGILLWEFETREKRKFKYSDTLKKRGYEKAHNYRLLSELVANGLLQKEGNGYYSFVPNDLDLIKKVMMILREMDACKHQDLSTEVVEDVKTLYCG